MSSFNQRIDQSAQASSLSDAQKVRYSRHLLLPEVGSEGQKRLLSSRVLLVGAGGLGSPLALYLAASGVGTLGIVEFDTVEESNLQRQVLYSTSDAGKKKVDVAQSKLLSLNPDLQVIKHPARLDSKNAMSIFADYDVIVDGSDNFATRYLVNDCCVLLGKPSIYGSVYRFDGQVSVFYAARGPCYRCLYPSPPAPGSAPSCAEGGVIGVLPGVIGTLQATEVLKLILDIGEPLIGKVLLYDAKRMSFETFELGRDPNCAVCGKKPTITSPVDYEQLCGLRQESETIIQRVSAADLYEWQQNRREFSLIDVRSMQEREICLIENSLSFELSSLEESLSAIAALAMPLIVYCKSGRRSEQACKILQANGIENVYNLDGGIIGWIEQYDHQLARY